MVNPALIVIALVLLFLLWFYLFFLFRITEKFVKHKYDKTIEQMDNLYDEMLREEELKEEQEAYYE